MWDVGRWVFLLVIGYLLPYEVTSNFLQVPFGLVTELHPDCSLLSICSRKLCVWLDGTNDAKGLI